MSPGKGYNGKSARHLKSLLDNLGEGKLPLGGVINGKNELVTKEEKEKELNKEIIRRLRIQNKKLLEQVIKLKDEIKKAKINKVQVLSHINELLKLINS